MRYRIGARRAQRGAGTVIVASDPAGTDTTNRPGLPTASRRSRVMRGRTPVVEWEPKLAPPSVTPSVEETLGAVSRVTEPLLAGVGMRRSTACEDVGSALMSA